MVEAYFYDATNRMAKGVNEAGEESHYQDRLGSTQYLSDNVDGKVAKRYRNGPGRISMSNIVKRAAAFPFFTDTAARYCAGMLGLPQCLFLCAGTHFGFGLLFCRFYGAVGDVKLF